MNKLIIICGGDNLGKTSLIEGLVKHFDYKNITLRHCDKPPKDLSKNDVLKYQMKAFRQERNFIFYLFNMNRKYMYHDNIIIYDRFYLGEYTYSQMFRGGDPKQLKEKLIKFEKAFISHEVFLITLTADPEFFFEREKLENDSGSLSKNLEEKTQELNLFKEAHKFSIIANKLLLKVDKEIEIPTGTEWRMKRPNVFRTKQEILDEVIKFIK